MHCGPRYRHYNDICFLFKVQPFPCGKTRLQITVFRMCGISCESWHNVFPLSLQQTVPPNTAAHKSKGSLQILFCFHTPRLKFILRQYRTILNSVYTRSGQNSTPNSNATNLHSSQKRCCSFCISSSNASPTFQVQKSIFHQMTKPIQVTVILPLLLAISFSRNDDIHSSISGISNDLIGVIPTIGQ